MCEFAVELRCCESESSMSGACLAVFRMADPWLVLPRWSGCHVGEHLTVSADSKTTFKFTGLKYRMVTFAFTSNTV